MARCRVCNTKYEKRFFNQYWCGGICKKLYFEQNKPKPIAKQSDKRKDRETIYQEKRDKYMDNHPICECCESNFSEDLHHKAGRIGDLLTDESKFMACCRECHTWIHEHPKESREKGYLI